MCLVLSCKHKYSGHFWRKREVGTEKSPITGLILGALGTPERLAPLA